MATHTYSLRCYAKQVGDSKVVAVCVDLNLVAKGHDFEDAILELRGLIHSYVESSREEGRTFESCMSRRAPLRFQIEYFVAWFQYNLGRVIAGLKPPVVPFSEVCTPSLHA